MEIMDAVVIKVCKMAGLWHARRACHIAAGGFRQRRTCQRRHGLIGAIEAFHEKDQMPVDKPGRHAMSGAVRSHRNC